MAWLGLFSLALGAIAKDAQAMMARFEIVALGDLVLHVLDRLAVKFDKAPQPTQIR